MAKKPWNRKDPQDAKRATREKGSTFSRSGQVRDVVTTYIVKESQTDKNWVKVDRGGDAVIPKSPSGSPDW